MIPVTLTIKGLYSYQNETFIDFTKLTAAGLFGIFGAVGSGKSTILEAITFALYGETERLNSRDGRGYNMMNLKSNEMLIDFEFSCGSPKEKYRFKVSSKRNKKRYIETTAFDRKAYQLIGNAWQPIAKSATELLGLSYDNFKRTIIIPQGKFQEFLQLKETERVQMLKEIFNLEKYELGPQVTILTKANDLKISHTEGQMHVLPIIDEVAMQEKQNALNIHQKQLGAYTLELQKKQEADKAFESLKQLFADLQIKTKQWNRLKEDEQTFLRLEKEVNEYEICEKLFKSLFENKLKKEKSVKEKTEHFAKQKMAFEALKVVINEGEAVLQNLEVGYKTRENLLQQAAELEKITFIKQLKTTIDDFEKRVKKGCELISKKEIESLQVKTGITTLQDLVLAQEQSLPDTSKLIELSSWFATMNQWLTELAKALKEMEEVQNKLPNTLHLIEQQLKKFYPEIVFDRIPPAGIETVQTKADQLRLSNNTVLKALTEELAHLQLSQKLEQFVLTIQPGLECPLCGSVDHPHILSVENVTEGMNLLKQKMKDVEESNAVIQQCLIALSGLYAEYTSQQILAQQKAEYLAKLTSDFETYKSSFLFSGYSISDEQRLQKELQQFEEMRKAINELRNQITGRQTEVEKLSNEINKFKAAVEKLNRDKSQFMGEQKILQSQIIFHQLVDELTRGNEELQINITRLQKQYEEITREFERFDKSLQQNRTELGILTGKLEEMENQLFFENGELQVIIISIESLLQEKKYIDDDIVMKILDKKINIVVEKENIFKYQKDLFAADVQKKNAEEKVAGMHYDEQIHLTHSAELTLLSKTIIQKTELLTTFKNDLQKIKEQLAERIRLQADLDKLIERSANLKTLSNLFRSSGFVNYVSSVYLQNLINAANNRFHKMTRQKLLLELTEENAFSIRDFMNNGEVRSIKTLSGGQTFQAALSLALALADNIQHLTKSSENFFFLDEGFGSLDKNALSVVFETLQSLKKEHRIVGVISHIEEMQVEVQINLLVVNETETGSRIYESWK